MSQPKPFPAIQGRCPACRGDSLFIGNGGYVTCSRLDCPNPAAADQLLHGEQPAPADGALTETRGQIERVRKVIAERQAEVAEREADGMLPFGTPGASWCDAVTVTCARVQDALKVFPPPTPVEHQATGQPMIQAAKEAAGYTDSYQLPGRDSGPSVAEAAANDRAHWDNKHAGEGP